MEAEEIYSMEAEERKRLFRETSAGPTQLHPSGYTGYHLSLRGKNPGERQFSCRVSLIFVLANIIIECFSKKLPNIRKRDWYSVVWRNLANYIPYLDSTPLQKFFAHNDPNAIRSIPLTNARIIELFGKKGIKSFGCARRSAYPLNSCYANIFHYWAGSTELVEGTPKTRTMGSNGSDELQVPYDEKDCDVSELCHYNTAVQVQYALTYQLSKLRTSIPYDDIRAMSRDIPIPEIDIPQIPIDVKVSISNHAEEFMEGEYSRRQNEKSVPTKHEEEASVFLFDNANNILNMQLVIIGSLYNGLFESKEDRKLLTDVTALYKVALKAKELSLTDPDNMAAYANIATLCVMNSFTLKYFMKGALNVLSKPEESRSKWLSPSVSTKLGLHDFQYFRLEEYPDLEEDVLERIKVILNEDSTVRVDEKESINECFKELDIQKRDDRGQKGYDLRPRKGESAAAVSGGKSRRKNIRKRKTRKRKKTKKLKSRKR